MTRLISKQVADIPSSLGLYDTELIRITGASLKEIACSAARIEPAEFDRAVRGIKFAAVPFAVGLGVIGGFSRAVESIACHIGCSAFTTKGQDITGLIEAIERGASVLLIADDQRFVAIHLTGGWVIDNDEATARGYVAALDKMIDGGVSGRNVLVIGAGRLGSRVIATLLEYKAKPAVYDLDHAVAERSGRVVGVKVETSLDTALAEKLYIIDASPAEGIIRPEHLKPGMAIAAPGIPCGLNNAAYELIKGRVVHDLLQVGTVTMLAMIAAQLRG